MTKEIISSDKTMSMHQDNLHQTKLSFTRAYDYQPNVRLYQRGIVGLLQDPGELMLENVHTKKHVFSCL
jgi:hypothetical protein